MWSAAYTAYCIIPRSTVSRSQPVSQLSTSFLYSILTIASYAMNRGSASVAHASRSTASRFAASRLTASRLTAFGSIAASSTSSKYSSNLDRSCTPSVSSNSLNLDLGGHLYVHAITASKWIPQLTWSLSHHVHLKTCSITASKYISEFTCAQSPSASPNTVDHSFHVHLQTATAVVWWYRDNGGRQSDGEYILYRPWSRQTSHFHLILSYNENTHSIFPNFLSHSHCPRVCASAQLRSFSTLGSIISSHPIRTLCLMNSIWMWWEVRRSVDCGLSAF